ncbi:MAG TPA: carbon-nitrogen hydrolase family protein [Steroidobacteraceae bacterium]|nr:carbon-nitrogen hydrolase family protein [Steroidobacteraceae bacterium]
MPGDVYPRFRAAAVQAAPVFLDRDATIVRLEQWVGKAKDSGADLVVFGESYIPGFPLWNMLHAPIDQHVFYRRLFDNALAVPGPQVEQLGEIARRHGVVLSVGVTEKGAISMGAMWNTNLLFDSDGRLLNRHRKLVPTWAEKLSWADGDASNLRVEQTSTARLGALICGENTNTLARFALLAQGEQVHIATYPPAWPTRRPGAARHYDLTEAIRIRSAAHAFEGKVFNVVAACALDEQTIEDVAQGNDDVRNLLASAPPAASMILGPDGRLIAEPQVAGEGLVVAEIDVSLSIEQKQFHDLVGSYNRFDIFRLTVDQRPHQPISLIRDAKEATQEAHANQQVSIEEAILRASGSSGN